MATQALRLVVTPPPKNAHAAALKLQLIYMICVIVRYGTFPLLRPIVINQSGLTSVRIRFLMRAIKPLCPFSL